MKRKKNLVMVVSVIVFVCVLLLGINTAFSVSRIEASFALFSDEAKDDSRELQDILEENYEGKLLFFLNTEKVTEHFSEYPYLTVTEIKKVYPNRLLISVEEKKEQYAFVSQTAEGVSYYITDSAGVFLRESSDNENNADGGANFIISGLSKTGNEQQFSADENYNTVMNICKILDERTGGIRTCLQSLQVTVNPDSSVEITLYTIEGVTIYLDNPANLLEKKTNAAMDVYLGLSDANKLYGRIIITDNANDQNGINSAYSPRE